MVVKLLHWWKAESNRSRIEFLSPTRAEELQEKKLRKLEIIRRRIKCV